MMCPNGMCSEAQNACSFAMSVLNGASPESRQSVSMCRKAGVALRAFSNWTIFSIAASLENGYASISPMETCGNAAVTPLT